MATLETLGIPRNQRCFICHHVFEQTRWINLITLDAEGDWCFLCGDVHTQSADAFKVVGIGHMIDADPTVLDAMVQLRAGYEAERESWGKPWQISLSPPEVD